MRADDRRVRVLNQMGVQVWGLRDAGNPSQTQHVSNRVVEKDDPDAQLQDPADKAGQEHQSEQQDIGALGWEGLRGQVARCTACALHAGRTQTVFGTGSREAKWLIVGEAPGAEEDAQGEPFVGRAGKLLDAMIQAVGASREQIYIANIVKCRPPSNRNPRPDEAASCAPYLQRQIALLQPQLILAVGRVAANNLLGNDEALGALRGQVYEYSAARIPLIVTYHPAYLLRKPSEKRKAWEDLKLALEVTHPVTS